MHIDLYWMDWLGDRATRHRLVSVGHPDVERFRRASYAGATEPHDDDDCPFRDEDVVYGVLRTTHVPGARAPKEEP